MSSIIKVIGVGGGGTNAVNHMYNKGIKGVNFIVCNTDEQHLYASPVPTKILLGPKLTRGLGTGANPDVGRRATEESITEIKEMLGTNTEMLFITAGMGKGTGTGGSPAIAKIAREMGILTIGIVSSPFSNLGASSVLKAKEGIESLKEYVDAILIISNDKIREMYGSLKGSEAFAMANDILATAAKGISEIITIPGEFNTDIQDVKTVLAGGGMTIMGSGYSDGEDRAKIAVKKALESPLLNDGDIRGAKKALLNVSSSREYEVTIDELEEILDEIRLASRGDIDIIFGSTCDDTLGEELGVTLVVTGFNGEGFDDADTTTNKMEDERKVISIQNPQMQTGFAQRSFDYPLDEKGDLLYGEDDFLEDAPEKLEEDLPILLINEGKKVDDFQSVEDKRKQILNEMSLNFSPLGADKKAEEMSFEEFGLNPIDHKSDLKVSDSKDLIINANKSTDPNQC